MKKERYLLVLIQDGNRIPQIGIPIPNKIKGKEIANYLNSILPENLREEEHYELQVAATKYYVEDDRKLEQSVIKSITEDYLRPCTKKRYKIHNKTYIKKVYDTIKQAMRHAKYKRIILPSGVETYDYKEC